MRNTYLIDFENVGSDGLVGVNSLTNEDRVIIFYSANSSRMTFRAHQQILTSTARFDYFEVTVGGKNALDHQLGTYLGYLVATSASERYFIVSHDNGFKFLSAFWLSQDNTLQIAMADNIKTSLRVRPAERPRPTPAAMPARPAASEPVVLAEVRELIPVAGPAPAVERKPEPAPAVEHKPEPAPAVERKPEPAPAAEHKPEPSSAAEHKPEPAPAAERKPEPAAEVKEVKPEPAVEVKPEPVTGPLPALGSQSRSRTQHRRIRSESVLATLTGLTQPAEPASQPVTLPAPAGERPVTDAQPAAPVEAQAIEVSAAEPQPAEAPAAEAAHPAEPGESKSRRSRGGRQNSRSRGERRTHPAKQDAKPAEPEAAAAQPAEKPAHADIPAEKTDSKQEKPAQTNQPAEKADSKPAQANQPAEKADSKLEKPAAKPAEPQPHVISDAAAEAIHALLQPYSKVNEGRVRELIAGSKKQVLCNTLRRQLGQEQGLALYNQIKRLAWK